MDTSCGSFESVRSVYSDPVRPRRSRRRWVGKYERIAGRSLSVGGGTSPSLLEVRKRQDAGCYARCAPAARTVSEGRQRTAEWRESSHARAYWVLCSRGYS
ncbi:hypothetical protein SCP_0800250 [Sparassis crispa]|uniref:Uncharacterized protein n=1 Tax=Sparassis crispa TaxID=139825 RepID=A0A401GTF7_9APHY|nr:hypothetical protein SCP_0800250 [Sparassis crispa]GBE85508.1 hypothetical protein SCP_0800250 [Sparassis crispa]